MKYLIIHQDQIDNKLHTEIFKEKNSAKLKQLELRKQYHDVILLSEQQLLELKLNIEYNVSNSV
jgi:hypothetical protein